jgi:hypothetical protein
MHSCTHTKDHRQVLRIRIRGDEPVAGHTCEGTPTVRHLRYTCISLAELSLLARSCLHDGSQTLSNFNPFCSLGLGDNHPQPSSAQLNPTQLPHHTQHFKKE